MRQPSGLFFLFLFFVQGIESRDILHILLVFFFFLYRKYFEQLIATVGRSGVPYFFLDPRT